MVLSLAHNSIEDLTLLYLTQITFQKTRFSISTLISSFKSKKQRLLEKLLLWIGTGIWSTRLQIVQQIKNIFSH